MRDQSILARAFSSVTDAVLERVEMVADFVRGRPYVDYRALMIGAARRGDTKLVALALDHGVDKQADCALALRLAVMNGHTETARLLLELGADIHAEDELALRLAAANGHVETTMLLLERGADIDNAWVRQLAAGAEGAVTLALAQARRDRREAPAALPKPAAHQ